MKKKSFFAIFSTIAIGFSTSSYAMNLDFLYPSWSTTTGASVFIYGLTLPGGSGACNYRFQNTTSSGLLSNTTYSGFAIDGGALGIFQQQITNATNCNAIGNNFNLIVNCAAIWNGHPDYAGEHNVNYSGVCTL